MRLPLLSLAVLVLSTAFAAAQSQPPVEPIINQTGQLPLRTTGVVSLKFAIVTLGDLRGQAFASATVTNKAVSALTLVDPGVGYQTAPAVTITGGGGKGATATAVIANGRVTGLTLTNAGSNYRTAPTVTIAAPPANAALTTLWSNDNTLDGTEPKAAVSLRAVTGSYSALLGYTGLPNMAPLPPSVFTTPDARLRVWYRLKSGKYAKVVADAPLQTPFFSNEASYAATSGTGGVIPNGAVTTAAIADGAITSTKLGAQSVTLDKLGPGVVLGSFDPADPQLTALGYVRLFATPQNIWAESVASGQTPSPRQSHTAVYTGTSLIVWGGNVSGTPSGQGGEYLIASDNWSPLSSTNAPAARVDHTTVWTGAKMIVWGGSGIGGGTLNTGAVYDQPTQSWRATAATNAPADRTQHTAVWTGDQMLVWGGLNPGGALGDGGAYVPPVDGSSTNVNGVWTVIPVSNMISARHGHTAVWTGTRMIVWGGLDANDNPLADGSSYDPGTGQWTALPATGAPSPRFAHTAVWTGSKMIVFGGASSDVVFNGTTLRNDGAIYDPATGTWTALAAANAPEARANHQALWTGFEMVVFSGQGINQAAVTSASAFNPVKSAWRSLPASAASTALKGGWSGRLILAFGLGGLLTLDPAPSVNFYGSF